MTIRTSYKHTLAAAYLAYIAGAITNNFAPLLFLTFSRTWDIPLSRMALLITVNFGIQLAVDLLSALFVERIGYRRLIVSAHLFLAFGLVGLGLFPYIFPSPYIGILAAVAIYAVGGGLLEVLVSPIAEACPTTNKEAHMSLLHSFYCWGYMLVILLSTAFFVVVGLEHWRILACLWALIPLANAAYFLVVPIRQLNDDTPAGETLGTKNLLRKPIFWLFFVMMFCAGAGEQAMSQWASAFAEAGLGVSKTVGDLLGPCLFALCMGLSRLLGARIGRVMRVETFMAFSAALCVLAYLIAALSPWPGLSLVGCGLCGFSVGIFWPGTFSLSAASTSLRGGGTALFAFLALAGDLGCAGGPALVSLATEAVTGGSLKTAMLFAILFPALLIVGLIILRTRGKNRCRKSNPSHDDP